ncbi:MAG TPA: hypothetical protein VNW99_13210, partial [Cytophagaceae bacterium]|nr:hypothetical protein [Cytophagaceae bacterium]
KGDLNHSYEKFSSCFYLNLHFRKNDRRVNPYIGLMIGSVTGQNPNYSFALSDTAAPTPTPNKFFKTSLLSVNFGFLINIIKKENFNLYIGQGLGLMRLNPKDADNKPLADQFNTRANNETFNNFTFMLPTYAGMTYRFKNDYRVGFQAGWLNPTTDYIDNISVWGDRQKKDNILSYKFSFYIPLQKAQI